MSGPIVRKYGFPNHEQIFGRRPPEHGVEEPKKADADAADPKAKAGEAPKADPAPDQRGAG